MVEINTEFIMPVEQFKPIKDFEGLYEVSNLGNIKSIRNNAYKKGGLLNLSKNGNGYLMVRIYKDKRCYKRYIHRLVAEAFIPNPLNKKEVNHINGISDFNYVSNLEWCTSSENCIHAIKTGANVPQKGIEKSAAKLNEMQVRIIRKLRGQIPQREIGKYFNVAHSVVSNIQRGKSWVHI